MKAPRWSVVVPTVGRPSLARLLDSLAEQEPPPTEVLIVDDRRGPRPPLDIAPHRWARVLRGKGAGPAGARNIGWRAARGEWVVFLDDDVLLPADWSRALTADLAAAEPAGLPGRRRAATELPPVAGVQGRIVVPLPADRRSTDWERSTAGLATARWATADMAYRRQVLARVGGFDERFRRAYREDADLALRVRRAGFELRQGERQIVHPVRPASRWVSAQLQRGNSDDALMRRLHGRRWRREAECPRGRLPWHAATTLLGFGSMGLLFGGRGTLGAAAALGWLAGTAQFAARRIAPGPRTASEATAMALTSVVIPPLAVAYRVAGALQHRRARPWAELARTSQLRAVLFDRDGTLVHDVPYNNDPAAVRPIPGARAALDRLRAAGLAIGVVSNQSGVARGLIKPEQLRAVDARIAELLGPFDTWQVCIHGVDERCACRKPQPGMVLAALAELGIEPEHAAVVGDIGADVAAALAAGAMPVLVPTPATRPEEIAAAPCVAATLADAVELILAAAAPEQARRAAA